MNKFLSVLVTGLIAGTLSVSTFAATLPSTSSAVKTPTASAAPMKHKHMYKLHKSHKAEKAEAIK